MQAAAVRGQAATMVRGQAAAATLLAEAMLIVFLFHFVVVQEVVVFIDGQKRRRWID